MKKKINKLQWSKTFERNIHTEEIEINCLYTYGRPVSIDLIHQHLLSGENMDYKVVNVTDSFEAFDVCSNKLVDSLKDSKSELMYFEHRDTTISNILVAITKENRTKEAREHLEFWCVVRLTVMPHSVPVGYCRFYKLRGA